MRALTGGADRQRGSASLLVVAVGAMVAALALAAMGAVAVLAGQAKASQAADLAALSAAEKAWSGEAAVCGEALRIAAAHSAEIESCVAEGLDVQVRVVLRPDLPLVGAFRGGALQVRATARAGPPNEH